jgi:hypothetical protein
MTNTVIDHSGCVQGGCFTPEAHTHEGERGYWLFPSEAEDIGAAMNRNLEQHIASLQGAIEERDLLLHQLSGDPTFSLYAIGTESGPGPQRVAYFKYQRGERIVVVRVETQ